MVWTTIIGYLSMFIILFQLLREHQKSDLYKNGVVEAIFLLLTLDILKAVSVVIETSLLKIEKIISWANDRIMMKIASQGDENNVIWKFPGCIFDLEIVYWGTIWYAKIHWTFILTLNWRFVINTSQWNKRNRI